MNFCKFFMNYREPEKRLTAFVITGYPENLITKTIKQTLSSNSKSKNRPKLGNTKPLSTI